MSVCVCVRFCALNSPTRSRVNHYVGNLLFLPLFQFQNACVCDALKIDVTETPAAAYIPNKSDTIAFDNRMMWKKQAQCPSVITLHVTALRAVIRKKVMKISLNL